MKRYDEMTYDEQEAWINYAEAEFCQQCGGVGSIRKTETFLSKRLCNKPWSVPRWVECDRCHGTGRP